MARTDAQRGAWKAPCAGWTNLPMNTNTSLCEVRHNRIHVVQGFGNADLEFRNFVEVVLFGGEVEGHGGCPVGVLNRRPSRECGIIAQMLIKLLSPCPPWLEVGVAQPMHGRL